MDDLWWKLEDLAGNHSGIRSCGLLFCWASLGDPASFIPLNRNFQQIGRFSITEWVRALPVLRLMASRARCLPLPKEEFLWHAPRRSRTPRKNQLACFCETCDACETGGVYCTVTILPMCTSRLEKVTPKSDNGWRQRFRFCHTIPPVLLGCVSLFYEAVKSRSFEKGMGCCRTGSLFPARAMKLSKYEMVPAQQISRGEIHICRQLHPKDGAKPQ